MSDGSPTPVSATGRPVALITGGGQRLGSAIALALGRAGRDCAVHYNHSEDGAARTCAELQRLGCRAVSYQADLACRTAARQLVDRVVSEMGRLDVLVASAASFERVPFAQLDDAAWDRSMGLNAASQFSLAHQATAALRATGGTMIFITCASTVTPFRNYLPYVVSKAATLQLARTLALELAPDVRVNAVAPGTVLPPDDYSDTRLGRLRSSIPLNRFGGPESIAEAVVYLVNSSFITGHQLLVDGGRSLAAVERLT